ncbi:hypothetical protein E8E13_003753 [Curvularia kusanoi]|uniref:Uncharacterized protein n=1 Tax=Curvularia kusanoi TaxID=90978 RepID=A0A9P4W8B1_CURKU|nr:hypothetical protein E8E13_003753 [Curvularia kusanoi]
MASRTDSTLSQLSTQFTNPSDVLSILLIIGGDIIQTALAQTAGDLVTPVCFSFGWVAYSFSTFVRVLGDGRLLPPPDYPAKVFNLRTSYVRENKNWIIGRILRDNELFANKTKQYTPYALRISIFVAAPRKPGFFGRETRNVRTYGVWLLVSATQIFVALVPWFLDREWGVLLVTVSGILASLLTGTLPQWRLEKIPSRKKSNKLIAITSGNGSRDIMIIDGAEEAIDLEELAGGESPRSDRMWQASKWFSTAILDDNGKKQYHKNGYEKRRANMSMGLPTGVWMTRFASFGFLVFWLVLLIMVAGLKTHSWYLVIVGSIGMLQNAALAAAARDPEMRGLPLVRVDTITTHSVMDGLMDLEATIKGAGAALLHEFFPGKLRKAEIEWWKGLRQAYDEKREQEPHRGHPRSRRSPPKRIGIAGIEDNDQEQKGTPNSGSEDRTEPKNKPLSKVRSENTDAMGMERAPKRDQELPPIQEVREVARPVAWTQRTQSSPEKSTRYTSSWT